MWLMQDVVLHPHTIRKIWHMMCDSIDRSLVTLIFDRLTLKLVCEAHLRWRTFLPNFGTLGLWVLDLFAIYAWYGIVEFNVPHDTL